MAITNDFMEAVQSGRMMRVRIMLKDSLLIDPTAAQFDEMEQYATEHMGNIYTPHDGERLNFDVSAWNEEYLNRQMVTVVSCFSRERVDLLKAMVRYLYKDKADRIRSESSNTRTERHITRKQIGTGVTAAGAVMTVAGICISQTILTIGGVLTAAAGVALIISDKGDS